MCFLLIYEKIVVYKINLVLYCHAADWTRGRVAFAPSRAGLRTAVRSSARPRSGPSALLRTPPRFVSVSHLNHGKPDDLVAQLEAGLEHVADGVLAEVLILHMHHCIVEVRIKFLTHCFNRFHAQLI